MIYNRHQINALLLCIDCDCTILDKFVDDCSEHYENMPACEVMNIICYMIVTYFCLLPVVVLQYFAKSHSQ